MFLLRNKNVIFWYALSTKVLKKCNFIRTLQPVIPLYIKWTSYVKGKSISAYRAKFAEELEIFILIHVRMSKRCSKSLFCRCLKDIYTIAGHS